MFRMLADLIHEKKKDKTKYQGYWREVDQPCHVCIGQLLAECYGWEYDGGDRIALIQKGTNNKLTVIPCNRDEKLFELIKKDRANLKKIFDRVEEMYKENGVIDIFDLVLINDETNASFDDFEEFFRRIGI